MTYLIDDRPSSLFLHTSLKEDILMCKMKMAAFSTLSLIWLVSLIFSLKGRSYFGFVSAGFFFLTFYVFLLAFIDCNKTKLRLKDIQKEGKND